MNKNIILLIGAAIALLFVFRKSSSAKPTSPAPAQPNDPFSFSLGDFGRITLPRGRQPANAPLITWNPNNKQNQNYNPLHNPQATSQRPSQQATSGQQIGLIANSVSSLVKSIWEAAPRTARNNSQTPYTQFILGPGDEIYERANGDFYRPDNGTIPVPANEPVTYENLPPVMGDAVTPADHDFNYDWADVV